MSKCWRGLRTDVTARRDDNGTQNQEEYSILSESIRGRREEGMKGHEICKLPGRRVRDVTRQKKETKHETKDEKKREEKRADLCCISRHFFPPPPHRHEHPRC